MPDGEDYQEQQPTLETDPKNAADVERRRQRQEKAFAKKLEKIRYHPDNGTEYNFRGHL